MDVSIWFVLFPVMFAVGAFVFSYLQFKEANDAQAMAEMKSTAYDTVSKLLNKILIAGKDKSISEQEWQTIADDVIKELNKRP
ncbi:MAG: hypothetical protein FWE56_03730 [Candidatus Bathyarchaeota archaeon]|nr:hypothetical protein [Candidatus Termiticorpusculum sp.]